VTIWSGSLDVNYAALLWTVAEAEVLGIDPERIALMGESAGGGHAALLALAARDRGEVRPAFQCLIYPMIDDRTGSSRQAPEHIGWFGWNPAANVFGWKSFLGCPPGGDAVPAAAVPSRRADLAGLPPTFVACGGLDLFVEENIEFAGRLICAGVPTELLIVPGAFHGFDSFAPDAAISRRFRAAKVAALRRALGLG
jgi:acetyl esterase/lipase